MLRDDAGREESDRGEGRRRRVNSSLQSLGRVGGGPPWGTKPRAGATPIRPEVHEGLEIAAGVSQRLGTHRLQRLAPLYSEAAEMVKPVGAMGVSGVGTG